MSTSTRVFSVVKDKPQGLFEKNLDIVVREPIDDKVEGRIVELRLRKIGKKEYWEELDLTEEDRTKLIDTLSLTLSPKPLTGVSD